MRRLLLAFAACAVSVSCTPAEELPPGDAGVPVDAGTPVDAGVDGGSSLDAGVTAPDSAAGRQLAWVLSMLNGGLSGASDFDLSSHFTAGFLAAVPVATLRAVFVQFAAAGPYALSGFEGTPQPTSLVALVVDARAEYTRLSLTTKTTEGDKLSGLLFQPAADVDPSLDSWAKVEPALRAVAPVVTYLEADVSGGTCAPVHAIAPQTSLALGSAFKLYVLSTLANQVDAGTRRWTDTVAIRDDWKSLPSGKMQTAPVGTTYSLKTYAEQMISISDNTATDHLLLTLGRSEVEAMVAASGHHDPTLNAPFLTTRELFTLKLMLTPTEQQAYVAAAAADKRTQLASYAARDPRTFSGPWGAPRLIDRLEWFASPEDLCKQLLVLKAYGERAGTTEVLGALALNPGVGDPRGAFSYVGFKGGSEPGVLTLTWLLRRSADSGWRVVTVGFNNTGAALDESHAIYLATAARALAGK